MDDFFAVVHVKRSNVAITAGHPNQKNAALPKWKILHNRQSRMPFPARDYYTLIHHNWD